MMYRATFYLIDLSFLHYSLIDFLYIRYLVIKMQFYRVPSSIALSLNSGGRKGMISLLLALNLLIHSVGWCRRNAPIEPKYPSCLKKYACFVPLLQKLIA